MTVVDVEGSLGKGLERDECWWFVSCIGGIAVFGFNVRRADGGEAVEWKIASGTSAEVALVEVVMRARCGKASDGCRAEGIREPLKECFDK